MRADIIFADLTSLGISRILLLVVIFAFLAWRTRRNMVITLASLTVILVCSGFLFMDSWGHGDSSLAALGAIVFIVALVALGIVIRRLLSGMGTKPMRNPKHNG